jgi:hypothetical protein
MHGSTTHACANSDTAQCLYEQVLGGAYPSVDSITKDSATQVTFTGTNFFTSGYTASVSMGNVKASTIVISSATSVIATWTNGVPIVETASIPVVEFDEISSGTLIYAVNSQTLANAIIIAGSSSDLTCSFAGGCEFEV